MKKIKISSHVLPNIFLLLPVIPALVVCLLIKFNLNSNLFKYTPVLSDEIIYWSEINTFKTVGFKGGYFTFEEHSAPAKFFHFDNHGPVFPTLYGFLGRLIGWEIYTGPIINLVLMGIALLIFGWISKPNFKQTVFIALLLMTFWPLMLYLHSNMQEGLHFSLAVILAGLFFKKMNLLRIGWNKFQLIGFIIIFLFSLIKPWWSFLLFPFLILDKNRPTISHFIFPFILTSFCVFLSFFIFFYWGAPYPFYYLKTIQSGFDNSFVSGLALFINNIKNNLIKFGSIHNGNGLEILQRYQLCFFLLTIAVDVFFLFKKPQWFSYEDREKLKQENYFHLFNLGFILVVCLLFFDIYGWADYRAFAPFLLLSLLVLIVLKRKTWLVVLIVLSNLILFPKFYKTYKELWAGNFTTDAQSISSFEENINNHIVYKQDPNGWCNTLLSFSSFPSDFSPYLYQFVKVPSGIGISVVFDYKRLELPIKSKYILLVDPKLKDLLPQIANVKALTTTPNGNLFLNLDSKCS